MFSLSHPIIHTANRLWQRSFDAQLGLISAGVAFFGFLAIFPAAAAVIALWGFASDPEVIRGQIALLQDFLPADAFKVLDMQVEALISSNGNAFGATTILSTLIALWSARAGVDALIQGLDAAYGTSQRGGVWHAVQAVVLTGTLIGVWLMRTHGFTAREAMGWLRIMRPGSVIGEQQAFLCTVQRIREARAAVAASAARAVLTGTAFEIHNGRRSSCSSTTAYSCQVGHRNLGCL
jgi:hypothetical protein